MKIKKKCVAMLLAGGQGSRLYALTQKVAKPAIPYGGKNRFIDFPLSNCINSGIDTVGVLTQYQPMVLNEYIGNGQPWDLDKMHGGVHVLPPYQTAAGASWYEGTANAIYQNIAFIERYDPEYVIVLGGDHIYKMDYSKMLDYHIANEADSTIAVIDVPRSEASRFGIMTCDETGRITDFTEKPKEPKSTLASMGIYVFSWAKLKKYLIENENANTGSKDFGKDIIPAMLQTASVCSPMSSRATGRTLEHWTACGRQTWICSARTFRWISMTPTGRYTPATTTCRPSTSAKMPTWRTP